jgi:hypothetical protein
MAYNQSKNPFSKNPLNFNSPLNSFDSLVGKLMNQGKSKEAATKIAGKVANAKMKGAGSGPTAAQKARMKQSPAKQAKPDFLDLDKDGNTTEPMKDAAKGSPANLKEKSPAELKSPAEKKLVGKQKNLPEGLKKAIEAAPESPAKMKSPMKKHGDKFRKRAMKLSEKAEQGDYDYDNPKVVELLDKAKEADKAHSKEAPDAKSSPAKKLTGMEAARKRAKELAKGDARKEAALIKAAEKQADAIKKRKSPAKMKSPVKKDGKKGDLLSRGAEFVKKNKGKIASVLTGGASNVAKKAIKKVAPKVKKGVKAVKKFAKEQQKVAT